MDTIPPVKDRSGRAFTVAFSDELGDPVTPLSATWSLTDGNGEIINEREDIPISPLAPSVSIAIAGEHNAHKPTGTREDNFRALIIKSTYQSAITGTTMAKNEGIRYMITDLPGV